MIKRGVDGQLRAFSSDNRVDVLEGAISDKRVSVSSIDSFDSEEDHETLPNLHPNMVGSVVLVREQNPILHK